MADFCTVARLEELPEIGGKEVIVNGRRICLLKHEGRVHALDAECPHKGAPLAAGWVENRSVFCALHGWQFDLKTGECVNVPGQAVEVFAVKIEDGQVQLRCD